MSTRQQLPPQIKKVQVTDRRTGKATLRYELAVDAGRDPQTGKRRQVRRRFVLEQDARDALIEVSAQASTETFVPRKAVTVDELAADWLASLHNVRATTVRDYEFALAPLRERHGAVPAQKLTRPDLDKLLTDLRAGGTTTAKGRARKGWSPRSCNGAINAWRLVLDYGVERRELAHNVAAKMKKVPAEHYEMDTYTPDEIRKLLKAADKDRNGHLWYLALNGLRRGEIAGLKWSDIDFAAGTLTVARSRIELGGGAFAVVESEPKTQASRRTLPLDEGLIAVLRRASSRHAQEKLALGGAHFDTGYVAATAVGLPYTPGALTHMWLEMADTAKVRRIRLHDARHSCGTAMHLRGVPLAVISKWLGHADAAITARLYVHSQDEALIAAGKSLGAVVTSGGSSKGVVTLS